MRSLARTVSALALAALVMLIPAAAASAAKKTGPAAWAKKHDFKGAWRSKDADSDGLKNLAEFKQRTNPRKPDTDHDGLIDGDEVKSGNDPLDADSDGDGTKDGGEHAGVVTAFDGATITIRQFKGAKITATLDETTGCGEEADDSMVSDDDYAEGEDDAVDSSDGGDWGDDDPAAGDDGTDEVVDLGGDDAGCDVSDIEPGTVLRQVELEDRDGGLFVATLELA